MGSTTADTSGNNYTGTLAGNIGWATTTSTFGNSLNFASSSASQIRSVSLPASSTPITNFPSSGSLSFWVNDNFSTEASFKSIFGGFNDTGNHFTVRTYTPGTMNFFFATTSSPGTFVFNYITSVLPNNTWTHFTLSWDTVNHMGYLYQNGVMVYSAPISSSWTPSNQVFRIGSTINSTFNGKLDEVSLYSRVLSPSEVSYLYSLSTTTSPAPDLTAPTTPTNLSTNGISTTTVELNWTASTDAGSGLAGYTVVRDGTTSILVSSTTPYYLDIGLATASSHTYSVYAYDYAGNQSAVASGNANTLLAPNASWWSANTVTSTSTIAAPVIAAPYTCLTNYYVSTTGNDSNSGTSLGQAWRNINVAVDSKGVNGPGVCINVASGTYHDYIYLPTANLGGNADTPTGYYVVRSITPHGAKLILSGNSGSAAIANFADYFVADGLDISGAGAATTSSGISFHGNYNWFINNLVHDNGFSGIGGSHVDHFRIEGNLAYNNAGLSTSAFQASGITVYQGKSGDSLSGTHNFISQNISFNNTETPYLAGSHSDGNGIIIDDFRNTQIGSTDGIYPYQTLVENNLVFGNGGGGIHVFSSDNVTVRNNTVFNNHTDPQYATGSTGTPSGDIDAVEASNVTIANNISVANPSTSNQYGKTNVPVVDRSGTYKNANNVWTNNLFFNGNVGESPIFLSNTNTLVSSTTNTFGANPQFINSSLGNFALSTGSPAIGAGTTAYGVPLRDLNGNVRTGSPPDLGTYAFSTSGAPDTTPPVISAISSGLPTDTSVTITWTTNEGATSQISYGTTSAYGSQSILDSALVTSHSVMLTGLTQSTVYHYQISTSDGSSNTATSSDQTFSTIAITSSGGGGGGSSGGSSGGGSSGGGSTSGSVITNPSTSTTVTTTTTSVPASTFIRNLTIGSSGLDVKTLQQILIARGFAIPAGATGLFGPQTRAALARFQVSQGITPAAGYFGALTRKALTGIVSTLPGASSTPVAVSSSFKHDIFRGSTDPDTRLLQQFLNNKGFTVTSRGSGSLGLETSYFGLATQAALKRYQNSIGFYPASGYLDSETRMFIRKQLGIGE
ncbi:MAG: LamG-like jellyroll fold domain-containing protein [Candidatus Paceibacterota bacterium]